MIIEKLEEELRIANEGKDHEIRLKNDVIRKLQVSSILRSNDISLNATSITLSNSYHVVDKYSGAATLLQNYNFITLL